LSKPILVLDFDGVIHGYQSGWKGASIIPDPPVPGALEFIVGALDKFEVHILSSRSHQWGGRRAMKEWLRDYLLLAALNECPLWLSQRLERDAPLDPWYIIVRDGVRSIMREIKWPTRKPAALYTIDDRAHQFDGSWPALEPIATFKPWNKRSSIAAPGDQPPQVSNE